MLNETYLGDGLYAATHPAIPEQLVVYASDGTTRHDTVYVSSDNSKALLNAMLESGAISHHDVITIAAKYEDGQ